MGMPSFTNLIVFYYYFCKFIKDGMPISTIILQLLPNMTFSQKRSDLYFRKIWWEIQI